MPGLAKSSIARADLLGHYVYLYEEAGTAVANRILDNAEKSFALLLEHPHIRVALTLRVNPCTCLYSLLVARQFM